MSRPKHENKPEPREFLYSGFRLHYLDWRYQLVDRFRSIRVFGKLPYDVQPVEEGTSRSDGRLQTGAIQDEITPEPSATFDYAG